MQSFICETLAPFWGVCVEVYIDDIIIHSATMEEHKVHVRAVMERLKQYEWTLRAEKCIWGCTEMDYLGHRLMGNGAVVPKDANVKRVIETPTISTREELHEFYERASYYRRLIAGFASNTKALAESVAKRSEKS